MRGFLTKSVKFIRCQGRMAEKQKDSAFDSLFMGKLGGMMDKFSEGDPMKGGGC